MSRGQFRLRVPGPKQLDVVVDVRNFMLRTGKVVPKVGDWCLDCEAALVCETTSEVMLGFCKRCNGWFVMLDEPQFDTKEYLVKNVALLASKKCAGWDKENHMHRFNDSCIVCLQESMKNALAQMVIPHDRVISDSLQQSMADLLAQNTAMHFGPHGEVRTTVEEVPV